MDDRGFKITKDPETGRIVSLEQTSERAAEIGALGGRSAAKRRTGEANALAGAILAALEHPDDVRLRARAREAVLRHRALLAVSGQTGAALDALESFAREIGEPVGEREALGPVGKNEICPRCGRQDMGSFAVTQAGLDHLRGLVKGAAWKKAATEAGWHPPAGEKAFQDPWPDSKLLE